MINLTNEIVREAFVAANLPSYFQLYEIGGQTAFPVYADGLPTFRAMSIVVRIGSGKPTLFDGKPLPRESDGVVDAGGGWFLRTIEESVPIPENMARILKHAFSEAAQDMELKAMGVEAAL